MSIWVDHDLAGWPGSVTPPGQTANMCSTGECGEGSSGAGSGGEGPDGEGSGGAGLYNLIDRTVELEVIPACKHYGLGFIPWSPLKGGVLGGLTKKDEGRRTGDLQQKTLAKHKDRLEAFEAFCKERGQAPADVALAWVLSNPVVTAPIVGPRTMAHLEAALKALEVKLDAEALKKLDEIFAGPGGTAPEAYAW